MCESFVMDEIIEKITALTNQWVKLIGPRHHKDKDCCWYITSRWSHGKIPTYVVEHCGYILSDIAIECSTYKEALDTIRQQLEIAILDLKIEKLEREVFLLKYERIVLNRENYIAQYPLPEDILYPLPEEYN